MLIVAGIIIAITGLRILKNPPGVIFTPFWRLWVGAFVFTIGLMLTCFSPLFVILWRQHLGG